MCPARRKYFAVPYFRSKLNEPRRYRGNRDTTNTAANPVEIRLIVMPGVNQTHKPSFHHARNSLLRSITYEKLGSKKSETLVGVAS